MEESKVYKALNLLLQESEYLQCMLIKDNLSYIGSTDSLVSEYCTVGVLCSRRAGHTTAIFQTINNHCSRNDIVVYCTPNNSLCANAKHEWNTMYPNSPIDVRFHTLKTFPIKFGRGTFKDVTDIVFFDNVHLCRESQLVEVKEVINYMANHYLLKKKKPFYYIKVQ